jgi:hypothetical protein
MNAPKHRGNAPHRKENPVPIKTQAPPAASREVLPEDVYVLTIDGVSVEEDQYAKPEKDGTQPEQMVVTWILNESDLTRVQKRKGVKGDKKLWQRLGLFYYVKADGNPTKLMSFLTTLRGSINADGVAFDYDDDAPDVEQISRDLVGVQARVTVEIYKKTKGARAGEPDNKIVKILPVEEDDEGEAPPTKPAAKNKPQPIAKAPAAKVPPPPAADDDDGELFDDE